jgi:hypothetical protein
MGCCKNCGCSTEEETITPQLAIDGPVAAIARFRSLAECGFFADELTEGASVVCQTRTEDEFDGLTDSWRAWYVLCVQEEDAERAVEFLSKKIAASQNDAPDEFDDDDPEGDDPSGVIETGAEANIPSSGTFDSPSANGSWLVPVLLSGILTAGVVWWLLPQRTATHEIAHEIGRSDQQWTQANSNGRIVRRMQFDRIRGVLQISEDSNGDGKFEHTREFEL